MDQLEDSEPTGDPEADREYRAAIQRRFADLAQQRREARAKLGRLGTDNRSTGNDLTLLEEIPNVPIKLAELSEELQRRLYDAFQLQVRYDRPRHQAVLKVIISESTIDTLTQEGAHESMATKPGKNEAAASFPCSRYPRADSNRRYRLERAAS